VALDGTQQLRQQLRQERDRLQARLRFVTMTLEGLDGLDETDSAQMAAAETAVTTHEPSDDRNEANPPTYRRGLSRRLAREAIVTKGRVTPEELARAMFALGWETPAEDPVLAARAAGNRLAASEEHIVFEGGTFVYKGPADDPPANGSSPNTFVFQDHSATTTEGEP
jgi:hypothetical protein